MKCIKYSSNNSGGSFWLSDEHWLALEEAGWEVDWAKDDPYRQQWGGLDEDGRYMGSLATSARRFGLSYDDAVREFERLTWQNADDEGCPCCGPPHSFYEDDAEPRVLKVQAERAVPAALTAASKGALLDELSEKARLLSVNAFPEAKDALVLRLHAIIDDLEG